MAAPMSREEKQWIALGILLVVGICIGFYFLYYQKASKQSVSLVKQKDELQAEVDKYKQYVEGPDAQAKINELKDVIAKFEQKLPNEKEIPALLNFMRDAADKSEIEYASINRQPEIPAAFYIEIPFKVEMKGKYHNIGKFINMVENHQRLMKVDNLDLTVGKEPPYEHSASIKLSTYVFNPNPTESKPAKTGK